MASALDHTLDIVDFDLGFEPGWFALPLEGDEAEGYAADLVAELGVTGPAEDSLRFQLERVQQNLRAADDPTMTSVVWIPQPESGYVACALTFRLAAVRPDDTPEKLAEEMRSDAGRSDEGYQYAEVGVWENDIDAGRLVGARQLLVFGDDTDGMVVERVLYGVFVPHARQIVQLIFTAESIGAFDDIAAQTQDVVATLRVRTEETR